MRACAGTARHRLQHNLALDLSIMGAMGASILLLTIYQPALLPETCLWCTPPGIGFTLAF